MLGDAPMTRDVKVGLALENFTPPSVSPDVDAILRYAKRADELGFDSLWAWDHILLGSKQAFPFLESLSTLAAVAAVTERVALATGVLVLPVRNPVVLAKVTSSLDQISGGRLILGVASGWYEREFEAVGVSFHDRGRIFVRNLDILERFWTEDRVTGEADEMSFKNAVMLPKPYRGRKPTLLIGGYVDRVLRRVATRSDGWLTYFYTAESFARAWDKILMFAQEAGRDPDTLTNVAQLPICIDETYQAADRKVRDFLGRYFDMASWSESTADSAIRGTPEQCVEQLAEHVRSGVRHIALVPWNYDPDQVERIATEVVPMLADVRASTG
jgi:probable F420-dependent oxidoreductase